jgi:hypothetical protein
MIVYSTALDIQMPCISKTKHTSRNRRFSTENLNHLSITNMQLYKNLTLKKFNKFAIIFCVMGDILLSAYIYSKMATKEFFYKLIEQMAIQANTSIEVIPQSILDNQLILMKNTLVISIAVFLAFHISIYLMYHYQKQFAVMYIKIYAAFAMVGCLVMSYPTFAWKTIFGINFLLQAFMYLFVVLGISYYQKNGGFNLQEET